MPRPACLPLLALVALVGLAPTSNAPPEWWPDWDRSYACSDNYGHVAVHWYVVPESDWGEPGFKAFQATVGGRSVVVLRSDAVEPRVVAHELGHALGFGHTWKPTTMHPFLPWVADTEGLTKVPTCIL